MPLFCAAAPFSVEIVNRSEVVGLDELRQDRKPSYAV